jgi:indolepyruvate ferredoxin oxidoreductase beta subunit
MTTRQQIVVSGVGGQGILFVTRLLAEAAIHKGLPVLTSETHGMAQRGGTVVSHLKVGDFAGPLIRPGRADGVLIMKAENVALHSFFLKPDGWAVVNQPAAAACELTRCTVDADRMAVALGNPRAVNLIMLGFALARSRGMFCQADDIRRILEKRLKKSSTMLAAALNALEAGYLAAPNG